MNKKSIGIILRALISISILTIILYKMWPRIGEFVDDLTKVTFWDCLIIVILWSLVEILAVFRICTLFRAQQGISIGSLTQLKFLFIGLFFNNFMLGATGGDIVRAYYLSHHTEDKKTEVVSMLFIDRIIGVFTMMVIALIFLVVEFFNPEFKEFVVDTLDPRVKRGLIYFFSGVLISVPAALLFFSKRVLKRIPFAEHLLEKLPFKDTLVRIYNSFHLYHSHRGLVVAAFFYSLLLQSFSIFVYIVLGKAIGIELAPMHFFAIIPLVFVVNALPISIGGLGVGESACVFFFSLVGVPQSKALALAFLYRISIFLYSLIGGAIYLKPSYKESYKDMQADVKQTEKEMVHLNDEVEE